MDSMIYKNKFAEAIDIHNQNLAVYSVTVGLVKLIVRLYNKLLDRGVN